MIPLVLGVAPRAVNTECRAAPAGTTALSPETLALLGPDAGGAEDDQEGGNNCLRDHGERQKFGKCDRFPFSLSAVNNRVA